MRRALFDLVRALGLWVRGRIHLHGDLDGTSFEMGGERFRAFRRITVEPGPDQPLFPAAGVQVRFRFRNLSVPVNRVLSLIPVPLIVAQPGFRSKTWYVGEKSGDFIGRYAFDSMIDATDYLESLPLAMMAKRVLPGSLSYRVWRLDFALEPFTLAPAAAS